MTLRANVGDVSAQFALDANALGNLKQQAKSDPKQALSAAAGQFEALFMQMLLKSMREALPQDGPLSSDASKSYTGMFDQQVAQQLSKKGIGIADMLVKQLSGVLPGHTPPAAGSSALEKARSVVASRLAATGVANTRPTIRDVPAPNAAPGSVAATVQGFIEKLRPYAEAIAEKLGVPAHYLIAQAGLETGWGKSQPRAADGTASNNLFGIKATAAWKGASVNAGTTEYIAGQAEKTTAAFRSYGSYAASMQDFANVLQKSRYASALANSGDAGKYAASLQQAGYATDPRYAEKLTRAIQTVARHLPSATQVVTAAADKTTDLA